MYDSLDSQKNIAFIYTNDTWLGGKKYLENLLRSIIKLKKKKILIISDEKKINLKVKNLNVIKTNLVNRKSIFFFFRKFIFYLFSKDILLEKFLIKNKVKILSHSGIIGQNSKIKCFPWIPDFQHSHLKKLFSNKEYLSREKEYFKYAKYATKVVVSCEHSKRIFLKKYPFAKNKPEVLNYRIFNQVKSKERKKKIKFKDFFFVPNQFWKHKNHKIIIDVLNLDKNKNNLNFILTGPKSDHRFPKYFDDLMNRINKNILLKNRIEYLGVVDEGTMQYLYKNCIAVVNPSLFEGWNTSVEEGHYNGKITVVSNLPVHIEQNIGCSFYFDKFSKKDFLRTLKQVLRVKKKKIYSEKQIKKKYVLKYHQYFDKIRSIYSIK